MTVMKFTRIAVIAGAVTTAFGMFAPPALASGPPVVDLSNSRCFQTQWADATTGDMRLKFWCDYYVNGGTGTVTAAYFITNGYNGYLSHTGNNFSNFEGLCFYDSTMTITARFTDSIGASDAVTYSLNCDLYG